MRQIQSPFLLLRALSGNWIKIHQGFPRIQQEKMRMDLLFATQFFMKNLIL